MTKVLIIKTSSMGDLFHTLPALTDASNHLPDLTFDWVAEEAFIEIPKWHPKVRQVIPVPLRRFRKQVFQTLNKGDMVTFLKNLRANTYDYVIDAQGLMKSAVITRFSKGLRCGLDRQSARESLASFAYQKKISVDPLLHAITRMRLIFSQALDYPLPESMPNYGLQINTPVSAFPKPYLLFIHGTTWETKEWPEHYWRDLVSIAAQHNYNVLLPWGNAVEQERARRIAQDMLNATVLPRTSLTEMAGLLQAAVGVVSVDTGLGHLSAALSVPTISLYGPTDPKRIGTIGLNQKHLSVDFKCAPCWGKQCGYQAQATTNPACFSSLAPTFVWEQLMQVIHP